MPRKLLPAALALGVLAVACGTPTPPSVGFGSGQQFIPQVADFLDDVGLYPSVAVDAQGTPYVTYFGFNPELAKGEIAPIRPIGSPSLPGVFITSTKDGIWTRGAVAMKATIPNVSVAFGPAIVPQVKTMTPANVNGTALAIDGAGGFHVVWVADTGLWYAQSSGTSFTATQVQALKPPVKSAGPMGAPGVAVAASGTPWIAYTLATAAGRQVTAASQVGGSWKSDVLTTIPAKATPEAPFRTAVGVTGTRPTVAFSDGTKVQAATLGLGAEGGWGIETVEASADGYGLSEATAKTGRIYLAYYAGPQVHVATSMDGIRWDVRTVATVSSGANQAGRSTGIAVTGDGTVYVTWYDPGTDSVRLASASGTSATAPFNPIAVTGTSGGSLPSVAAAPDGSTAYVAWYAEANQDLILGTYGNVSGLELAVRSPTPAGAPSAAPPTTTCTKPASGTTIDLVAQGIAFDTGCIQPPASTPWTIHFDNKDTATAHNVAIYPSSTQLTAPIERGALVTGPGVADYKVPALESGTYYFQCDVHPTQMNGQVVVK